MNQDREQTYSASLVEIIAYVVVAAIVWVAVVLALRPFVVRLFGL